MLKSTFSSLYSNNQYRLQLLTLLFQVVARSIYIVKFKTRLFQLRLPISKPIDFRISFVVRPYLNSHAADSRLSMRMTNI